MNLALVIAAGCGGDPAAGSGSSGDSSSSSSNSDSSSDSSSDSGSGSVSSSDSDSGSVSAGACVSDLDCDPSQDTACAVARCNVGKGSCAIVPLGKGTMAMAAQGILDGGDG